MAGQQGLHAVDYVIFAAMLIGTLGIGLFHALSGGRQRTTAEYLVGNRQLNFFPVSISLCVSFFSSILILGFPAEAYKYGGMYWLYAVGTALGAILSVLLFVPVFQPLQLTSVNQYLKMRFDSQFVAILGTLSSVTGMFLYTATIYYAPATAMEALTGFPTSASIVIGSVIAIIYTTLGGIKGVIWTDVFQAVLMLVGLLTITIRGVMDVGGIAHVWETCSEWGRLNLINMDPDPTVRLTFWSLTFGAAFHNLNKYGTHQAAVQRYCSMPTVNMARLCVLFVIPWTTLAIFIACLSGLTTFAFYTDKGCDPIRGKYVKNANQIIPRFIADALRYPGIQGIFLASMVSASLSSASSTLNSSAANIWNDVIRVVRPNLPEKHNVLATKLLVVACGLVTTALAIGVKELKGTVLQMAITFFSACGGPTSAMFLMGLFLPFANWIGAAAGGIAGFIFAMWMGFGSYTIKIQRKFLNTTTVNCSQYAQNYLSLPPSAPATLTATTAIQPEANPLYNFYALSYLWIALFSTLVAVTVGIIFSLLTGGRCSDRVASRLLHPWIRRCWGRDDDTLEKTDIIEKKNGIKTMPGEKEHHFRDNGFDNPIKTAEGENELEDGENTIDKPVQVTKL